MPHENEHSLELYVLGNVDKFEEIDGIIDEELNQLHPARLLARWNL